MAKKATATTHAELTIVNPVVESSAPVAEPQTDTHIGQAQAFCMGVLTFEVKELIKDGANQVQGETRAKKKGAQIIKRLTDMMFANGATYRDVGTKSPEGETAEGKIQRDELTRQIKELVVSRMDVDLQDAMDVDVAGIVRDFNKKRKADGLSSMSAVEIEALKGVDGKPLGLIPVGTMDNRKTASDIVSQYLKRLVSALKKLEPEEDSASTGSNGSGDGQEEEVIEAPNGKTPVQQAIDAGNDFAKKLRSTDIPDDAIAMVYQIIAMLGGAPE